MSERELTENELVEERIDLSRATCPNREQRANGINVWYGKASDLVKEARSGCLRQRERNFQQSSGCVLNFYLSVRIGTIRDAVAIYHAPVGCSSAALGYRELYSEVPIIHVNTSGFAGTSYDGYEYFFDSVIDQLLEKTPKEKGLVNVFGIVPFQHIFWKGAAREIKTLLEKIGLKANLIVGEFDALENLKKIPAAEYNIVLSSWIGHKTAEKLEEKFEIPYISFPGVPTGPKQTSEFLRVIGKRLDVSADVIEDLIAREEKRAYRFAEYVGDILLITRPHPYFAVVADSSSAVSITKYLANEMGYLPEVVQITDNPPEEARELINEELTTGLETPAWPEIIYEVDAYRIRENLKDRNFLFLLASSLEANISGPEYNALYVTISFPSYNRVILEHNYAGFSGGLTLVEDVMSTYAGPL